jgi:DNA-binding response OmpR family regulator
MKVLVAGVARAAALLARYEVTTARTTAEVQSALQKGEYGLLVVGSTFDDSRMFDLVREIRSEARHDALRIVCVVSSTTLTPACEALRAQALLHAELTSAESLISGGTP